MRAIDHAPVIVRVRVERPLLETHSIDTIEAAAETGLDVRPSAQGLDGGGRPATDVSAAWSLSDGRIGEIDSRGRLTVHSETRYYRNADRLVLT